MKVKAREGVRVPREDNPRRYIEQEAVDVPDSAYYQRRLIDGDLVEVKASAATAVAEVTTAKGSK